MKILKNRVLAEIIKEEVKNGIILSTLQKNKAKVLEVGIEAKFVKKGDLIQYHAGFGTPYTHEGKDCLFLVEDQDIEVILERTP
jgi:chaperonin GroES